MHLVFFILLECLILLSLFWHLNVVRQQYKCVRLYKVTTIRLLNKYRCLNFLNTQTYLTSFIMDLKQHL
uniref:Secreted protein n=1 Tax=Pristhesancus plagipennis TaxID=1955184 RepID=A0A2K8JMA9_PRIPG|nr:secreted hypothetical protein [Pristhesancus plagipennis]